MRFKRTTGISHLLVSTMGFYLSLLSAVSALKSKGFRLDLSPLIEGFTDGADVLIDVIIELLPFVILLGLASVIVLAFKFDRSR